MRRMKMKRHSGFCQLGRDMLRLKEVVDSANWW